MSETAQQGKQGVIKKHRTHESDTGSTDVQIAILTDRINHIVEHLKVHKKDHHTRRGLLILVGRRKRLLTYLKAKNFDGYIALTSSLGLKASK